MYCELLNPNSLIFWLWFAFGISLGILLLLSMMLWRTTQTLRNLRDEEALLRLVIETIGIGFWELDFATNQERWSTRSEVLIGFTPGTYDGTTASFFERVHPDDRAYVASMNEKAVQEGISQFDFRVVHPDQSIYWLQGIIKVLYNKAGQPIRMLGVDIDITERKQVELALARSEAQFRSLIDNLPFEVWALDRDRRCIIQNPLERLRWGDNLGQSNIRNATSPDMQQRWMEEDELVLAGEVLELEEQLVVNGQVRTYTKIMAPIRREDVIEGVLGVNIDVTERKQAEEKIKQLNQALEQQNRNLEALVQQRTAELESFSYSVSHDLRAPLRHVSGFVVALRQELERSQQPITAKAGHYLEVIEKSSKKMGLLIDGLLALSRLGRRQMQMIDVPLQPIVEQVITLLQGEPGTPDVIKITVKPLPTVRGDAVLLQQLFNNLLSNAVKFSRNQPEPMVEVKQLPDGTIVVQDNGVGFAMDYADKLFGAFQRLHSEKEFEGTGIGLAIVQRIVQRHNGSIWAESEPGQGAKFYLRLDVVF